jgi:hypothetical protein
LVARRTSPANRGAPVCGGVAAQRTRTQVRPAPTRETDRDAGGLLRSQGAGTQPRHAKPSQFESGHEPNANRRELHTNAPIDARRGACGRVRQRDRRGRSCRAQSRSSSTCTESGSLGRDVTRAVRNRPRTRVASGGSRTACTKARRSRAFQRFLPSHVALRHREALPRTL